MSNKVLILLGVWVIASNAVTAMRNPPDGWYPWFFRFLFGCLQVVKDEASRNPTFSALKQVVQEPNKVVTTTTETATAPKEYSHVP